MIKLSAAVDPASRRTYYRNRVRDLRRLLEEVDAERCLAVFRAHQYGATPEEIAQVALLDPADVRQTIDALGGEPDIDQWDDGPDWVRIYR
ncbi:hypothetical protein ACIBF5_20060 [Micromonospora sp. NPDC050417]|uniref:hypothetical protein n=1 Tax=Micromonospora sp. NPDC050417 TaxID=3364280 RepID=UPI0037AB1D8F